MAVVYVRRNDKTWDSKGGNQKIGNCSQFIQLFISSFNCRTINYMCFYTKFWNDDTSDQLKSIIFIIK